MLRLSLQACCILYFLLSSMTTGLSSIVVPRAESSTPAPIVFNPDENWDGIDGSWSSFALRVGTPAQTVRVWPSWVSYQTWVVAPEACSAYLDYDDCASSRGGIFNLTQSTSWNYVGIFLLWIERNLGYYGNAYYGYDTVTLGGLGENVSSLSSTTVGALAVDDFWLGVFGLSPIPTNWTDYDDPAPSYMTQLKEQNSIPSISFGYTAGASYRYTGVVGSLTLGGYDQNRFEANDVEFDFAADNERNTMVAIQSITTTRSNSTSSVSLLSTSIMSLVDSTISQIWLPLEACQAFEDEFGLIYDDLTDLYLVNSSLHDQLLLRNPSVNFTISPTTRSAANVTINLPYAAFDLTAQTPYRGLANDTSYFPLRRAANDTQYSLGRTFMQEAYITVDYERAKFNISQCVWPPSNGSDIVTILPPSEDKSSGFSGTTPDTSSSNKSSSAHLSGGAIGGIVVGSVLGVCALIGIFTWYIRREKRRKEHDGEGGKGAGGSSRGSTASGVGEKGTNVFPKAELEGSTSHAGIKEFFRPASSLITPTTPGCSTFASSSDAGPLSPASEVGGMQIFEMPGDMPERAQADGRQISEKDMMMRREEMYNGLDLSNPPTPMQEAESSETARRKVRPQDVVIQDEIRGGQGSEDIRHSRFSFE